MGLSTGGRSLLLSLLLLGAPLSLHADPRWWWDDALVGGTGDIASIDVAAVPPQYRGDAPAVFIAWVNPPSMIEGSLHLSASFDGGCTFCDVMVEQLFTGGSSAAIAVEPLSDSGTYAIQIAYTSGWPPEAWVLWDAVSVPLAGTPQEKCAALGEISLNRQTRNLGGSEASAPDIAAARETGSRPQFHAVWRQYDPGLTTSYVRYARDLSGDGSGWEDRGRLTDTGLPGDQVILAKVTADAFHGGAAGTTAVNVAFTEWTTRGLWYYRSVDSGTTFSATGAPPAGPPQLLSEGCTNIEGPLAFDSGVVNASAPLWHAAIWYMHVDLDPYLYLDAQFQSGPTTAMPVWQDPDLPVDPSGLEGEGGPALSVFPGSQDRDTPVYLVWTDGGPGGYDLFYRAGLMNSGWITPIRLDSFPIPAQRPFDPVVSTNLLLTACDWEETTGDCLTHRQGGRAVRAAMDEVSNDVFVAWIDDRNSRPQIWFKRTDDHVRVPEITLAGMCPSAGTRRITATWLPLLNEEPPDVERIRRYLVYYGTDPGGPYENAVSPLVLPDDGNLPHPVSVDIDDLLADTTYYVIVVPEDEARNVWPLDFDPAADRPDSPENEKSFHTPAVCPCDPLVFGGATTADSGSCSWRVSWETAVGEGAITYEVWRDGAPLASGLTGNEHLDDTAVWDQSHVYRVLARDSCPDPGPQEAFNDPTEPVRTVDVEPPVVSAPMLSQAGRCIVRVEADVTDPCSGPEPLVDVERDGVEVATGIPLPYDDPVPADGSYGYHVRGYDVSGYSTLSPHAGIDVTGCSSRYLYRRTCAAQDTAGVFAARDPVTDIAFAGPSGASPYLPSPILPGDPDPEQVLILGGDALIFYQLDGGEIRDMRVTKHATGFTVRIGF